MRIRDSARLDRQRVDRGGALWGHPPAGIRNGRTEPGAADLDELRHVGPLVLDRLAQLGEEPTGGQGDREEVPGPCGAGRDGDRADGSRVGTGVVGQVVAHPERVAPAPALPFLGERRPARRPRSRPWIRPPGPRRARPRTGRGPPRDHPGRLWAPRRAGRDGRGRVDLRDEARRDRPRQAPCGRSGCRRAGVPRGRRRDPRAGGRGGPNHGSASGDRLALDPPGRGRAGARRGKRHRSCTSPGGRHLSMRFQDAARDARAIVYAGIQADPLVARLAALAADATYGQRLMARAVMNGESTDPATWRVIFPTVFGPTAPDLERAEALLAASLEVAGRGEQVRSQFRGAFVEALSQVLVARRTGDAAVRRERRVLFDGVASEIHPYDLTVETAGREEAWDCKWGARGINAA